MISQEEKDVLKKMYVMYGATRIPTMDYWYEMYSNKVPRFSLDVAEKAGYIIVSYDDTTFNRYITITDKIFEDD